MAALICYTDPKGDLVPRAAVDSDEKIVWPDRDDDIVYPEPGLYAAEG